MEPTNWTFLGLVCIAAAVSFLAAVLFWPRVAGRGPKHLAARTVLLGVCQLAMTTAIVLVTNKYFVFYASWSDLLDNGKSNVQVKQVQTQRGKEATPTGLVHRTTTDLGPKRRDQKHDPQKDGRVDRLQMRGPRSGLDAEAYVYLPPQYFQPQFAHKRLPVVMLLSGGPSDDKLAWIRQAHLPEDIAKTVAAGRAQPVVYVMTRSAKALTQPAQPPAGAGAGVGLPKHAAAAGVAPRPQTCLNLPGRSFGQAEDLYTQDLPEAVGDLYRVAQSRKGWAVGGFGTSGQCAVRFAMLHSDRFAAGASVNGLFDLPGPVVDGPPGGPKGDLYGRSKVFQQDNDLLWRLEHLPPPPVSLLVAAGQDSGRPAQQADRIAALTRPPLNAEKLLVPGAPADLKSWRHRLPEVLGWLAARVAPQ
ncbi:alpha/beta hydrolase [Actinomadura macrotermitis]|uniref:Esterase n=1 Tax=Actinomadura macrotermitis TaxID=2585200 RepID=A0A7K0C0F0_9ACTN|nr:hypothetical protein [Actinomadura macrotermitis]MQY06921.1 hypothetical protein [Actinomadura macrotermitis]